MVPSSSLTDHVGDGMLWRQPSSLALILPNLHDAHLGNWDDESSTPVSDIRVLFDDFFLQVPGKNEEIVRLGFSNFRRRMNGNMGAGGVLPLLVRIPIDGILKKICTDSAIIQQGISFSWRSITRNGFPRFLDLDETLKEISFRVLDLLAESAITLHAGKSCSTFPFTQ